MPDTSSGERLRQLRTLRMPNASQAEAAARLGLKAVTYRAAESRGPSKNVALIVARKWGVSVEWLLTGRGQNPLNHAAETGETIELPVLDWHSILHTRFPARSNTIQRMPADLQIPADAFVVIVDHDDMTASSGTSFPRGNRLIFSPGAAVKPGDYVLAQVPGASRAVFRRYTESVDHEGRPCAVLVPINSDYPTYRITQGAGRIVARLMARVDTF